MLDFIADLFSKLNVSTELIDNYDKIMAVLSGLSFVLFLINMLLSKSIVKPFESENDKKIKQNKQFLDLAVFAINLATIFIDIPKDVYAVFLILSLVIFVCVLISFLNKVITFFIIIVLSFEALSWRDFGEAAFCLLMSLLVLLGAACGLAQGLLTVNKIVTLVRAIV